MSKRQAEIDAEFNLWFRKSFDALMAPHIAAINKALDRLCSEIDDNIADIQKAFDNTQADIEVLAKAIGSEKDADGKIITLRKLDDVIAKLRTEMREETAAKFKTLRAVIKKDLTQGVAASNSNVTNLISRKS
jgi:hypothetical protein